MTHEKLIKERNNIAKQIYSNNPFMNTSYAMVLANTMMIEMYGVNWNDKQTELLESKDNGYTCYNHVCENKLIGAEKAVYEFYNSVVYKTRKEYYADTEDIKDWTKDLIQSIKEESDTLKEKPIKKYGYDISIVDDLVVKWVRVQGLGDDFVIALHDLTDVNGEVMTNRKQPELIKRLKELNLDTFNRKQGFIIATLIEEINTKLIEAGGDKFAQDWYASSELWRPVGSSADYNGRSMWYFDGNSGCFDGYGRCVGNFRCRAVLDYNKVIDYKAC